MITKGGVIRRRRIFSIAIFVYFGSLMSCSKEETFSKEDMIKKAKSYSARVRLILPDSIDRGVSCDSYGEGCVSAHQVEVGHLKCIFVEYINHELALNQAKNIHGYVAKNWLFDDVQNEPKLEKFVIEIFGAKKIDYEYR